MNAAYAEWYAPVPLRVTDNTERGNRVVMMMSNSEYDGSIIKLKSTGDVQSKSSDEEE